ncbi:hypothetical protein [Lentzea cavernae]|uniref:Uncharacterized protein n=1 Tax=Lentzea cavernae TaxID=2020703 RepID=A0ABQ3MQF2_9PSEU|nr:hypothetical protein [Lentzea cavernae]GHH57644.1 hypothetical protein GCM10017774_77510 [Lentzea cavernae]
MNLTADIIAAHYDDLSDGPQVAVRLATLRKRINEPQDRITATLLEMTGTGLVHLVASANCKVLDATDHAAAVRIAGEDKHLLIIEPEYFQA